MPTLRAVLAAGGPPAASAASLAADVAADGEIGELVSVLWALLDDPSARVPAARALWRAGTRPAELTVRIVDGIEAGVDVSAAVALLVEMGAVDAVPRLERLAERDARIATPGADDVVWLDEAIQSQLREAVATLRAWETRT